MTADTSSDYEFLDWDSQFFGFPVARITRPHISSDFLMRVLRAIDGEGGVLVYWPAAQDAASLDPAEVHPYRAQLVDHKTTYERSISAADCSIAVADAVVPLQPSSADEELAQLAIGAGRYSRFFVDTSIPRVMAEKLYRQWLEQCLRGNLADEVLGWHEEGSVAGLVTIDHADACGSIGLLSVRPDAARRGIGSALVQAAGQRCADAGCDFLQVITQQANLPACRLYESSGFRRLRVQPYYHFWLRPG